MDVFVFDVEKYKSEVNRLGLEAVKERGTPDYPFIIEKLKNYFLKGYSAYLYYDVFKCEVGKADDTIHERIGSSFDYAYSKGEEIIESKVRNFNPEKASNYAFPFFAYLISDFTIGGKKQYSKDSLTNRTSGMKMDLNDHEISELNRILRLRDNLKNTKKNFFEIATETFKMTEKEITELWSKRGTIVSFEMDGKTAVLKKLFCLHEALDHDMGEFYKDAALILGLTEKEVEKVLKKYASFQVVSLDEPYGSDSDNMSLADTIDSGVRVEELDDEDSTRKLLLLLNKIYHDSFLEVHRRVFPPYFTNELIASWVGVFYKEKSNVTYKEIIEQNWDLINLSYKRKCYNGTEYLCISEWIYDLFEKNREMIKRKDIAEELKMTASNFKKVCDKACEIVEKYSRAERDAY